MTVGLTVGLNVNQNVGLNMDLTGDAEASKEMRQEERGAVIPVIYHHWRGQFPFSPVFVTGKTRIIDSKGK